MEEAQTVSCIALAKELGKKQGNLMRIIKSKKLPYREVIEKNENKRPIKHRYVSESVANEIRNPTRKNRVRWSNEKIDTYLKEHKIPIKRSFEQYTNTEDDSLWWQCLHDVSHRWQTSWGNIVHAGSGCHYCNWEARWTFSRILETIEKEHIDKILITNEENYIDAYTPMTWRCAIDGYVWESSWMKINWQRTGCHMCSGNVQWNIETIKEELKKPEFHNITYVSGDYKSNKESPLKWRCLNEGCDYEWERPWYNINVKGTRCPLCSMKGTYHPKTLERNKETFLKEPLTVYTLLCWDESSDEQFYKIGVTIKSKTNLRYGTYKDLPYKFKIINEIRTNRYDGGYLERDLLENHRLYRYTPLKEFDGWTECFSEITHLDLETIDFDSLKIYDRRRNKEKEE